MSFSATRMFFVTSVNFLKLKACYVDNMLRNVEHEKRRQFRQAPIYANVKNATLVFHKGTEQVSVILVTSGTSVKIGRSVKFMVTYLTGHIINRKTQFTV